MNPNIIIGLSILQLTALLSVAIGYQIAVLHRRYSLGATVVFLAEVFFLAYFMIVAKGMS